MCSDAAAASTAACTTQLGRWSVKVSWGAGRSEDACLFFVGAGQINFKMPSGLAEGQVAAIAVHDATTGEIVAQEGPLVIGPVEPGLFTASSSGAGLVTGQVFRRVNGEESCTDLTDEPILLQPQPLVADGARGPVSIGSRWRPAGGSGRPTRSRWC